MRPIRRRRFLVHSLQYRLLAAILGYFLFALVGVVAVIFAPLILDFSGGPSFTPQKYEAAAVFLRLHDRFWPVVLLIAVAIVLHSILISHRIGGPLYRFRQVFSSVAQGNLSVRVLLRSRDYPKAEAEALDEMLRSLRTQIQILKSTGSNLAESARQLSGTASAEKEFDTHLRNLQAALDFYKIESAPDPHRTPPVPGTPVRETAPPNSRQS